MQLATMHMIVTARLKKKHYKSWKRKKSSVKDKVLVLFFFFLLEMNFQWGKLCLELNLKKLNVLTIREARRNYMENENRR